MSRSRAHLHAPQNLSQRAADAVARLIGSWGFVLAQTAIILVWFTVNTLFAALRFDAFPFIFLNLALSCEAAFATSLIMISQNRQAGKDRERDITEAREVDELFTAHALLVTINQQQLSILKRLDELQPAAQAVTTMVSVDGQLIASNARTAVVPPKGSAS